MVWLYVYHICMEETFLEVIKDWFAVGIVDDNVEHLPDSRTGDIVKELILEPGTPIFHLCIVEGNSCR